MFPFALFIHQLIRIVVIALWCCVRRSSEKAQDVTPSGSLSGVRGAQGLVGCRAHAEAGSEAV